MKNGLTNTAGNTQTVERFLFPEEHYSGGRLKHRHARPPDTIEHLGDAQARFHMSLCSEITHVTHM